MGTQTTSSRGRAGAGCVLTAVALALAPALTAAAVTARAEPGGGTIGLKESFGVSHPTQLVELQVDGELTPKPAPWRGPTGGRRRSRFWHPGSSPC